MDGHVAVVLIRCDLLASALRAAIARPTQGRLFDADWEAQRVASACQKILGTRDR